MPSVIISVVESSNVSEEPSAVTTAEALLLPFCVVDSDLVPSILMMTNLGNRTLPFSMGNPHDETLGIDNHVELKETLSELGLDIINPYL